jgi:hypothetical protein
MNRSQFHLMLLPWLIASAAGAPGAGSAAPSGSSTASPACTLTPGAMQSVSFFWTPPEELTAAAWKISASTCDACAATGGLTPTSVSFGVRWFRSCSALAQVLIVGARTDGGCPVPDTTKVLCGPATFTISNNRGGIKAHTLQLPGGCCISGDAFLLVRFTGFGGCSAAGLSPGLAASSGPCVACEQYVSAANIYPTLTEWCSVGAANSMWFSMETQCCLVTPVKEHSWGRLRVMYR